jgi:hypothetical protein
MIVKHLNEFFKPSPIVYTYELPRDEVVNYINSIFEREFSLFDECDMSGYFIDENHFSLWIIGGWSFSNLNAEIASNESGGTLIKLQPKLSTVYYIFFILAPVSSIALILNGTNLNGTNLNGFYDIIPILVMLFLPVILVRTAKVAIVALQERYLIHVHRPLRKRIKGVNKTGS